MTISPGALKEWVDWLWASLSEQRAPGPRPLEVPAQLPLTVDDITPRWLSGVLGAHVGSVRLAEVIHGSGSKVLVEVTYPEASTSSNRDKSAGPRPRSRSRRSPPLPPDRLCIKGGFNPSLLEVLPALFGVYRLEAQFYHHIAPRIPGLRLVPSYWCGVDQPQHRGQGIVVLQDLKAAGYTFGDPLRTWSVSRARGALSQLARLHAATWGARQADLPWVPRGFGMRDVITGMMSPESWAARFDDPAVRPPIPDVFWAHRERVVACLEKLWGEASSAADKMVCMVHGDTQVGNTFIDTQDRPGFLDWQCIHVNSAAHDVTYFMSGALTIEDRRNYERDLFSYYLMELARAGGPRLKMEDVWDEYRKYQMQGFAWALAGPMMQPKEIVDAISERHCAAILDHQSMELLESL